MATATASKSKIKKSTPTQGRSLDRNGGVKLVIVESPTKARTISGFLGSEYQIESSYGHVRDLPKSKLGIDTANDFEPSYIIPVKARKRVNELKKPGRQSDRDNSGKRRGPRRRSHCLAHRQHS